MDDLFNNAALVKENGGFKIMIQRRNLDNQTLIGIKTYILQ